MAAPDTQIVKAPAPNQTMVNFATEFGVEPGQTVRLLRETALKSKDSAVSTEEIVAFMIVCNTHKLNPFLREIHGFMSKGKMMYVVGVDGWITLCNRHPQLNGIEFEEQFRGEKIFAVTCKIHRKDRTLPIVVTEYFSECYRDTDPWNKTPIRMNRHKSLIQCARIAFGFAGIIDEDEAERLEGFTPPTTTGVTIEGSQYALSHEANTLMNDLKWNEAARKAAARQYHGNDEELVKYLQAEKAKQAKRGGGKKQEPAAQQAAEPEPSGDANQEHDGTEQEHRAAAETNQSNIDTSWME